jgi:hypothetical protein
VRQQTVHERRASERVAPDDEEFFCLHKVAVFTVLSARFAGQMRRGAFHFPDGTANQIQLKAW